MSKISFSRSMDATSIQQFSQQLKKVSIDLQKPGRHFVTKKDPAVYTMNELIKNFDDIATSKFKDETDLKVLWTRIRGLDIHSKRMLEHGCCLSKIFQVAGNFFFKVTHRGFNRKALIEKYDAQFRKVEVMQPPVMSDIDSSKLVAIEAKVRTRSGFLLANWQAPPAVWSYSQNILPEPIASRLIHLKKDSACGVKAKEGDYLTNMEGALHSFLNPVSKINMLGDKTWKGFQLGVYGKHFESGVARPVVFSGLVQPDFENDEVLLQITEIKDKSVEGKALEPNYQFPGKDEKWKDKKKLSAYENDLRKHMIYHLTQDHQLPSLDLLRKGSPSLEDLEALNHEDETLESIRKKFKDSAVNLGGHILSVEVLFNLYVEQVRNEMRMLEQSLPQGYVLTIDPPSIFLKELGGVEVAGRYLNRLHALAYRCVNKETPFKHAKVVAFSDFDDKGMIEQLKKALSNSVVVSKELLFKGQKKDNTYLGNEEISDELKALCMGAALVIHNNSDGFGQNIETEGESSMDGVIGFFSDAYATVLRGRHDYLMTAQSGEFAPVPPLKD